jgi:hypothetical protein
MERKTNKRGGGVLIYVHENFEYCVRNELSVSDRDKEIVTIEITNNKTKNILLSCCYRPPDGVSENLSMFLQQIIKKGINEKKENYLIGDLNMNCFQYNDDNKIKNFYDAIFETGSVTLINRPTRVTKNTATLIDNIITTDIFNHNIQKGIIKTDISDHFPLFLKINKTNTERNINTKKVIRKRIYNETNLKLFKDQLSLLHWNNINLDDNANNIYETFF